MKKLLALTLALVMIFALVGSTTASATAAQYSTTQEFLNLCDQRGTKYTYVGISQSTNNEQVRLQWTGDNINSITVNMFFDPDLDAVYLYCWNIINFSSFNTSAVTERVNQLNADTLYVKWWVDTSDNSVTGEISCPVGIGYAGQVAYEAMRQMVLRVDNYYPQLSPYAT